jgi:Rad3-related DNA helicase
MDKFLKTEGAVFISPSVAQGMSFDGDLAEFQIIITPSYGNIDDPLTKNNLAKGLWHWYNTQALIVFLQQCGRVVRSKDDVGFTHLLDSRFNNLIRKTWKNIPEWFKLGLKKS